MKAPATRAEGKVGGLFAVALVALLALTYGRTLRYPFVFDDKPNIEENLPLRAKAWTPAAVRELLLHSHAPRRPVANISLALNHRVGGLSPFGYRLVNLLIHALNAWLVYCLARRLWRWHDGEERRNCAAAAALLWALHPLQTNAVAYVVQRMTSLATCFFLLATLFYLWAREPGATRRGLYWAGAGISWLLALGSKEIAVTWPLVIFLIEWVFVQQLCGVWLRRSLRFLLPALILMLAAALVFLEFRPVSLLQEVYKAQDYTPWQRLLTQSRVVLLYLSLLIWPWPGRLTLDHDVPVSTSLLTPPATMPAMLLVLSLVSAAAWLLPRRALPAFAGLWFFINLLLESTIVPLEMAFEHRLYLPSVMLCVAAVWVYRQRFGGRPRQDRLVLVLAVGALALGTWRRNQDWRDPLVLWQDCVRKAPGKSRTHSNFGYFLRHDGRPEEAIAAYEQALALDPDSVFARNNLAVALIDLARYDAAREQLAILMTKEPNFPGLYANLGLLELAVGNPLAALAQCRKALALAPDTLDARLNLGLACKRLGRLDEAVAAYQSALQQSPRSRPGRENLALTLAALGDHRAAVEIFTELLAEQPDAATVLNSLGVSYQALGRRDDAQHCLQRALALAPDDANANLNLGNLLVDDDPAAAEAYFQRALALAPELASVHTGIGVLRRRQGQHQAALASFARAWELADNELTRSNYLTLVSEAGVTALQQGQLPTAVAHLRRATELAPGRADLRNNLGAALGQAGQFAAAIVQFEAALRLRPDYADAQRNLAAARAQLQP